MYFLLCPVPPLPSHEPMGSLLFILYYMKNNDDDAYLSFHHNPEGRGKMNDHGSFMGMNQVPGGK